jgi:hypothetical protein
VVDRRSGSLLLRRGEAEQPDGPRAPRALDARIRHPAALLRRRPGPGLARPRHLCQGIEPFPTAELTSYEPSYLSGFLAEENAIDLPEALESAKERMRDAIRAACAAEVPGDTHRNLEVETTFSALAYKNALLPIWVSAYDYHGKPYRYLVNGVTGKCTGTAPWSVVKVTLLVLTIIVILLVVMYAAGG